MDPVSVGAPREPRLARGCEGRSVQQLAEVLASLSSCSGVQAARQRGVEQIADGFESEIGVLVCDGAAVASVGFGDAPVPAEVVEIAAGGGGTMETPDGQSCIAVAVPVPIDPDCVLLLARSRDEPFLDEEASLLRSLGRVFATVLDALRLRDELARNQQTLADAQRVARLGSFEWDLVALQGSWSAGLYRILGLEDERPAPDLGVFLAFIHPDDQRRVQQRVQRALAGERVDEIEYRIVRRDKTVVWVRARSEVERDAQGQPILFRGALVDINHAKAVEEALRATTARLALLGEMAAAANETSQLHEVLDFAIARLRAHTGWPSGQAYMPSEFATASALVKETRAGKSPRWAGASFAFPVRVGGEVACVLEFVNDAPIEPDTSLLETIEQVATQLSRVAERERADGELAAVRDAAMESSRMKSEFLATMSHEIRTPLNGVIGLTGLLLSSDLDERQLQYAEGVETAGESLLAIINDILDFSKIEAGRLELDESDFDLVQVMEEAVGLVALTAHRKGLELVCRPDLDLPTDVRGDPAHLRQVLLNLTSNAAKFTSVGEIVVRAGLEAELDSSVIVRFDVTDSGIGIDKDMRDRVFEPFSQADPSTTRKYGGTGLGLAICRRLVDAMGGEIGVDSELGEGSDFWFTVPLRRQSRRANTESLSRPAVKVLIADPNASVRDAIADRLRSWGVTCEAAPDGAAALEMLRKAATLKKPFDLLLADELLSNREGAPILDAVSVDPALNRLRVVTLVRDAVGSRGSAPMTEHAVTSLTKPVRVAHLREVLASPSMPLAAPAPTRNPTPIASRTESRGHVLVVEDNATNQLVAVGILRFLGYRADVAANGYEALEAMERTSYDAVLMDCQMPEMDGYTATGLIRENESNTGVHTPVIAMTAGATDLDRDRCLASGMDDYLAKPVKTEHIEAALRKWTARSEATAVAR